ncbi:hypothetical protein MSAR_05340 [Mycolicibacterium sarraceniae]|uniref:Uncharacterized protein n=1 Tax=Mycolicibacterium sarraceniae TaxID=1534348 RepID=A0A7I7SKX3_9MYCO|nr:hypothetical protein MSAR_05340 [Mycolicibacterium sarraceniae]
MPLNTVALELVPPNIDRGTQHARHEAHNVLELAAQTGLAGRIGHVMIPGMIAEDDDRPIDMQPKLDVVDFWSSVPNCPAYAACARKSPPSSTNPRYAAG